MGMSSSQARLLNLTARMHQIEYKAAKLEAQKLQMANESRRVYDNYLNALEAHKMQYKFINANGSIGYKDATLKALENGIVDTYMGETSGTTVYLQNMESGRIMLTSEVANKFGITGVTEERTLEQFLIDQGLTKTKVVGYNKVSNNLSNSPSHVTSYNYHPVANEEGGVDYSVLDTFATFSNTHSTLPAGVVDITNATASITSDTKYKIDSASDLVKLFQLSQSADASVYNSSGTEFYLSKDITSAELASAMSSAGVADWTGIQNFKGKFDGNGYSIDGLTGSQGLFKNTTNTANIVNLKLTNVNITGSADNVGGIVGSAISTNIRNCYISGNITNTSNNTGGVVGKLSPNSGSQNISYFDGISSRVNVTGNNYVGGIIGYEYNSTSVDFNLRNSYAIGDVTGNNYVGGVAGHFRFDNDAYIEEEILLGDIDAVAQTGNNVAVTNLIDSYGRVTDICNVYAGGTVTGSSNVGGFVGKMFYWGDGGDYCFIVNSQSTGKVVLKDGGNNATRGAFAGALEISLDDGAGWDYEAQKYVNFVNCVYSGNSGADSGFGNVFSKDEDDNTINVSDLVLQGESTTGLVSVAMLGSLPSVADFTANIMDALIKGGYVDPYEYGGDPTAAATYAQIAAFLAKFPDDHDIDNSPNNTKMYYLNKSICEYLNGTNNGVAEALNREIIQNVNGATAPFQAGASGGKVTYGDGPGRAIDGHRTDKNGLLYIPSQHDMADQIYSALYLAGMKVDRAKVDTFVAKYHEANTSEMVSMANINNMIQSGADLTALYNAVNSGSMLNDATDYNTGDWVIKYANSNSSSISYDWDYEDPAVSSAVAAWTLAVRGVDVVDDDLALSNEWLTNMVETGQAILTDMNPDKLAEMGLLPVDDLLNMSDEEYNAFLEVENTSVATNTSLQEVADEAELRKVEAQYEADMKRIDRKDRRYDTELAALDTERNAIKQEIDTLKTVAKDNVERTFKLFG